MNLKKPNQNDYTMNSCKKLCSTLSKVTVFLSDDFYKDFVTPLAMLMTENKVSANRTSIYLFSSLQECS
jgi:hypothetical protein